MSEHQKHVKVAMPDLGNYARQEWSIHGATCSLIQDKVHRWIELLHSKVETAFLDASHQEANDPQPGAPNYHFRTTPEGLEYFQHDLIRDHDLQISLNRPGILFINGNHFSGERQIVILEEKKKDSLSRKTDRLTNVSLILTTEDQPEPYDFLAPFIDPATKILGLDDDHAVVEWLLSSLYEKRAPLKGLVLAGGRSVRMGKDKGTIRYHEKDQREHTADLLNGICQEVFISCRPDQTEEIQSAYPLLPDTFLGLGPFGALLSAFRQDPNAAWLVVACDLPLLDLPTLEYLVNNRGTKGIATAFRMGESGFPEPLITIWEPTAYPRALEFLALGYSCPRKVLINSATSLLDPPSKKALTNVNTKEEMQSLMKQLAK